MWHVSRDSRVPAVKSARRSFTNIYSHELHSLLIAERLDWVTLALYRFDLHLASIKMPTTKHWTTEADAEVNIKVALFL